MGAVSAYDLDGLGWLLFERLATDAAERELGIPGSAWQGAADERREALCEDGVPALGIRRPAVVRMAWVRRRPGEHRNAVAERVAEAAAGWTDLVIKGDPHDGPREEATRGA